MRPRHAPHPLSEAGSVFPLQLQPALPPWRSSGAPELSRSQQHPTESVSGSSDAPKPPHSLSSTLPPPVGRTALPASGHMIVPAHGLLGSGSAPGPRHPDLALDVCTGNHLPPRLWVWEVEAGAAGLRKGRGTKGIQRPSAEPCCLDSHAQNQPQHTQLAWLAA